ncbi:MAG TPA: hypothetical protein VF042_11480 [Gemmatimonadaceae bacterium]
MYSEDNFELNGDERAMLASLPREMPAGDMLEARVVRALRTEGHFGGSANTGKRGISLVWKIAAAIMLFAGGVATGRYILASNQSQSASVTAPASNRQDAKVSAPESNPRPLPSNETVVAVREMWL